MHGKQQRLVLRLRVVTLQPTESAERRSDGARSRRGHDALRDDGLGQGEAEQRSDDHHHLIPHQAARHSDTELSWNRRGQKGTVFLFCIQRFMQSRKTTGQP